MAGAELGDLARSPRAGQCRLLERLERQNLEGARSSSSALRRRHAAEQAPWQVGGVYVITGSKGHPHPPPKRPPPAKGARHVPREAAARALLDSWICD